MSENLSNKTKSMSLVVTKGSLDWAYPPFILATTAASMGLDVSMFFTFYGLSLLQKNLDLEVTTLGNPAMKMPMGGLLMQMPNLMAMMPGAGAMATSMMKNMIENKGIASIDELRDAAIEGDVRLIGCQMTMDMFEFKKENMIDEMEVAGAATYIEAALEADINLFI